MFVCDRCRKNEATYRYYIAGKGRDLCRLCERDYRSIEKKFDAIEELYMKNVNVHINFYKAINGKGDEE